MRRQGRALHAAPGLARSGGYACAILYGTGIVEVTPAESARDVIGTRRTEARSLGVALDDWWTSLPHTEWQGNVRRLAAACRDLGGRRAGPGRFSGVDFGALCQAADRLPLTETGLAGGQLWGQPRIGRDERMATAACHRAEGLNVRESAALLEVSHTTVVRDLARWDLVGASMPLEVIRLSRPGTSPRNIHRPDAVAAVANVPNPCSNVVSLRRPA